jgi:bifunctional non-homologous end joining protein LigD
VSESPHEPPAVHRSAGALRCDGVAPCEGGAVPGIHRALSSDAAPGGAFGWGWLHEIKFDGYRTQADLRHGRPAIYTRAGYDRTLRFQPIADGLAILPATDLILDGEAVVADSRGVPDFGLLHADLAAGRKDGLLYYAFDLLYLDGFDLRRAQLAERKRVLSELLADTSERILYAEHLEGDGTEVYERACAMGLEGIISKTAGRALSLRADGKLDQGEVRQTRHVPDRQAAKDRLAVRGPP